MRKYKLFGLVFLLISIMGVSGCTNNEETTEEVIQVTEAATEEETEEETEEVEEKLQYIIIGEESDTAYSLEVYNNTEKIITEFYLKLSEEEDYGKVNMISANKQFTKEDIAKLYIGIEESDKQSQEEKLEEDLIYDIQVVCEDKTTMEFHNIEIADMKEFQLCLEDGISFIKYNSIQDKEEISTKEAEQELIEAANKEKNTTKKANNTNNKNDKKQAATEATAETTTQSSEPYVVSQTPSCSGPGYDKLWSDGRTSHSGPDGEDIFD